MRKQGIKRTPKQDAQEWVFQVKRTPKQEQRYITYAQSPEMVDDAQERVFQAMFELLHNPQTPKNLYENVAQFVCEQSSECSDDLYHTPEFLKEVLESVRPEELMAARERLSLRIDNEEEVNDATN